MDPHSSKKQQSRYQVVPVEDEVPVENTSASLYSSPNNATSVNEEETNSLVSSIRHPLSSDVISNTSESLTPKSLSRANSSLDDDWDDDDDAENLQRYSFVLNSPNNGNIHSNNNATMAQHTPLSSSSAFHEHWNNLRSAARQRRAARLLSMTDQSWYHRMAVGFLNTCCDATDTGIAVAAGSLLVWLSVGMLFFLTKRWYWWMGCVLFGLRFSARRVCEWWRRKTSRIGGRDGSAFKTSHRGMVIASGEQEVV